MSKAQSKIASHKIRQNYGQKPNKRKRPVEHSDDQVPWDTSSSVLSSVHRAFPGKRSWERYRAGVKDVGLSEGKRDCSAVSANPG